MALVVTDGFEHYESQDQLDRWYRECHSFLDMLDGRIVIGLDPAYELDRAAIVLVYMSRGLYYVALEEQVKRRDYHEEFLVRVVDDLMPEISMKEYLREGDNPRNFETKRQWKDRLRAYPDSRHLRKRHPRR